ncbi:MAG: type I 3-dehydroquinate dehydratase [Candidatus Micrarchaeota archaeon]
MICVSIAEVGLEKCKSALLGLDLAELRLDQNKLSLTDLSNLLSSKGKTKMIATCRPNNQMNEQQRKEILLKAIEQGADFVDVEIESEDKIKQEIIAAAKARRCKVILSYHNYEKTPSREELKQTINWCFTDGADIAKIACKVNDERDNARLIGLLDQSDLDRKLIVIGMGEKGKITRIIAPLLGSFCTYVSLSSGKETADGQIDKKTLEEAIKNLRKNLGN